MKNRFRKITAVFLVVVMVAIMIPVATISVNAGSVIESAIAWAIDIANDDSHLYSQSVRWGPSYDCSSFVISAYNAAGVDTGSASWTGNMIDQFTKHGFIWIDWSQIGNVSNLQRGDVLLYHDSNNTSTAHTEIYLGNNMNVGAHSAKRPAADQISVSGYYWHPWHGVLRYAESNPNPPVTPEQPSSIWADYVNFLPGDITVHWNSASNATSYWLTGYITYPNGTVYCFMAQNVGNTTEHKMTLMDSGKYTIYVSSVNGDNVSVAASFNFEVISKQTAPQCLKTCTYNGHTYKLYSSSQSWENAKTWCESNGGYLATVTSNQEQSALWKLLENYSNMSFYLGGSSISGKWEWVTGEEFKYTTWAKNQPDCAGNAEFYLGTWGNSNADENLKYWNDFTNNYNGMTGFIFESGDINESISIPSENLPTVGYSAYTGDCNWRKNAENGEILGDKNGNRFRAIKVNLNNCNGGIKYAAHFSDIGWSDFVNDCEICGSIDEASSIEAIKIELYGDIANLYNVYYCTYVKDQGWFGWAKNGEISGTTGGSLPITALRIVLVPKIEYSAHLKDKGWQNPVNENETSGTIGESRRIEAVKLELKDTSYGNISYSTHIEDIGWAGFVFNGNSSGTTGLGLQTEAIRLSLDGKASDMFDIIYKVHISDKGWLDWVRNGEVAGTVGQSLRTEAYKALIVPKGFSFDKESYKKLTQEKYTVTFDSTGGNCNIKSKLVSYCGFYGELPIPQKDSYVFGGWYETLDGKKKITSTSTLEKKSDIVLYARWLIIGDVNSDGVISIVDATDLQKYLANIINFDDEQLAVADTNGDGSVSIADATQIQKYLAQLIPSLG